MLFQTQDSQRSAISVREFRVFHLGSEPVEESTV